MRIRFIFGVISLLTITALSASCNDSQQNAGMKEEITVTVQTDTDTDGISLYLYPLGVESDENTSMSALTGKTLIQTIPTAPSGLYEMVCVKETSQYMMPLYIDGTQDSVLLSVRLDTDCPVIQMLPSDESSANLKTVELSNANLDALNSFNALYYTQSREVWTNAANMSEADIRSMITKYEELALQSGKSRSVTDNVKDYIRIWAYLQSVESGNVFNRMNSASLPLFRENGANSNALLDDPQTVLDSPVAPLHQSALNVASQAIPKGSLESKLEYIAANYSDETMRSGLQRIVLNSFIRNYNYAAGFQNGLDALTSAKDKYDIDDSFIESFRDRFSAIPGAPFPEVELIDTEGSSVSIDQFRGKFIYIDLWASWCGPCCKEVPYLQALEKELKNDDNIVFVSISTDSGEQPWRDKMSQLDMHGNQWLNTDGKLCDRLNVSGIPHFLIYDREGKLHTYDAPRPSSGSALKAILQKLSSGQE